MQSANALSTLQLCIHIFFIHLIILTAISCDSNKVSNKILISENNYIEIVDFDTNKLMVLKSTNNQIIDRRLIENEIFQLKAADINNDSTCDILLGVIKKTRFDMTMNKRLFIYTIDENKIIQLWLGSKLSQPLIDYNPIKKEDIVIIRTIEQEKNNNYLIANYKWDKFGLKFINYSVRNINLKNAYKLLKDESI